MRDIIVAVGLFLVIEGLVYALAPSVVRSIAVRLPQFTDQELRLSGLFAVSAGVLVVWLIRG